MKLHHRFAAAVLFVIAALSMTAHAVPVSGQGTWETTLQGRDLDGNLANFEAYYDTVLGITWLANANYAQTNGHDDDGAMTWTTANAWAASLNPYGSGISGWRLPYTNPIDGTTADDATIAWDGSEDRGYNVSAPGTLYAGSTASEMAHLYFNTLGNKAYCAPGPYLQCTVQTGWGLNNTGPFSNLQDYHWSWSATPYAPFTDYAWTFHFDVGDQDIDTAFQDTIYEPAFLYAWAVHSGDVGASVVPLPATIWLFGSGLAGLIGFARCKKQAV